MKGNLVYWRREGRDRMRILRLTYCCDSDREILNRSGLAELRRQRGRRLIDEASKQGIKLSYQDLSLILLTSKSTLKRDLRSRS